MFANLFRNWINKSLNKNQIYFDSPSLIVLLFLYLISNLAEHHIAKFHLLIRQFKVLLCYFIYTTCFIASFFPRLFLMLDKKQLFRSKCLDTRTNCPIDTLHFPFWFCLDVLYDDKIKNSHEIAKSCLYIPKEIMGYRVKRTNKDIINVTKRWQCAGTCKGLFECN